jgi:single-strand DNA-binding protein
MYLNKAVIIGNLTRDPEIKALPSGSKVCSFSLATNRVWKDKNGAKQESVDYHNIVVFGRQAETTAQYLKKGSSALVEGRLQTRSWDGQDGQKRYRTEIVADRVQFGTRSNNSSSTTKSAPSDEDTSQKDAPPVDTIDYPEEEINPDDIPF